MTRTRLAALLFLLAGLFLLPTLAFAQHTHAGGSDLDPYVELVSELTGRPRANVYFANPQDIFHGVQVNFVNVGTGNLTFLRRDLVAAGRIPLVLARIYDSASAGGAEFGPGWMLSAAETISVGHGVATLSSENGCTLDFVEGGNNTFVLKQDRPSDYSVLQLVAPDTLRAPLRTALVKEYKLIAGLYRLVRVADRNGNEARLSYANGVLSRLENAGHFIALTRNEEGRIVLAQDDLGRQVRYSYDPKGNLVAVQDVGGAVWRYSYDQNGRLAGAQDPAGRMNFGPVYDGAGRVRLLQLPSGSIQFAYDPASRSTTVIDRRALQSRYFQNEEGITTQIVNALGEQTAITLDAARNPVTLSRNGAVVSSMQYDQQHRLLARHTVTSAGAVDFHYSHDAATGLLARIDSSDGASRVFTYDAAGNLSSALLEDGLHKYSYSASGDLAAYSTAAGGFSFTATPDGLIASMKDPAGALSTFGYRGTGELSLAGFADGRSAGYDYQPSGLRARLLYKDGRRVEYTYDPVGNLISTRIFDAKGKQVGGQTLTLNDSYQVVKRNLFDGSEESFQYDPNGNLIEHMAGTAVTRFEYDALNRLVAVLTPDGQRLTYSYEPGEPSIVDSYEHSRAAVADLRDTGFTFAPEAQVISTRPVMASWGALRFSESLGTFQLANAAGTEIITPEVAVEQPLRKLELIVPGAALEARQGPFQRPFNPMFMPGEYATINCCPLCTVSGGGYLSGGGSNCTDCDPGLPPDPTPAPISIVQDKQLWYFGGPASPPTFTQGATTVTLTVSGATNGTFQWALTNGAGTAAATFGGGTTSVTKINDNTVTLTSQGRSIDSTDAVTVSVTYTDSAGNVQAASLRVLIESPNTLSKFSSDRLYGVDHCTSTQASPVGTNGWAYILSYEVRSRLGGVPVQSEYVNETFDSRQDSYPNNNWASPIPGSTTTIAIDGTAGASQFQDQLCVAGGTAPVPVPMPPFTGTTTLVFTIHQIWYSGDLTSGAGIAVLRNIIQFETNQATVTVTTH